MGNNKKMNWLFKLFGYKIVKNKKKDLIWRQVTKAAYAREYTYDLIYDWSTDRVYLNEFGDKWSKSSSVFNKMMELKDELNTFVLSDNSDDLSCEEIGIALRKIVKEKTK